MRERERERKRESERERAKERERKRERDKNRERERKREINNTSSMSWRSIPAFSRRILMEGTGPMPMMLGSQPAYP